MDDDSDAKTDGKIYEAIIFDEVKAKLSILQHDSYRSDAAKAAKAHAISAKLIPVLEKDWTDYAIAGTAMLGNLQKGGIKLAKAASQKVLVWHSDGVECKGVLDHHAIHENGYIIDDLKVVADASPKAMQRSVVDFGWDIQAAAYLEGFDILHPELAGRGIYRLIVCEKSKPYATVTYTLSAEMLYRGLRLWNKAKQIWAPCLRDNVWPSYRHITIDPTPWQMSQAEALEAL